MNYGTGRNGENNNNGRPVINYAEGTRKRKLVLVVDVREGKNQALFEKIKSRMEELGAVDQLEVRQLDIFDFQFVFFDNRERTFGPHIERKTAQDAADSIKDGRWSEQMGRAHGIPNKIHIFEGNLLSKYYRIDPKSLIGAVLKPAMRHEFDAMVGPNMEATADMLVQWFTYLEHVDDVKVVENFSYVDCFQAEARKRDFREGNRLALMIKSFVQGGSAGVAKAVEDRYGSLGVLQAAFIKEPLKTKRDVANLMYMVNDRFIRVGPAATKEIYNMCDVDTLAAKLGAALPSPEVKGRDRPAKRQRTSRSKKQVPVVKPTELEDIDDDDDDDDNGDGDESIDKADPELVALLDKIEDDYNKRK